MIKHIRKISNIIGKNIKIIFRNWTSFMLLILGPFVLVLLIGLVFSSSSITGIKIGIASDSSSALDLISGQLSKAFPVTEFEELETCKDSLIRSDVHVCVNVTAGDSSGAFNGKLLIVHDNSKIAVSKTIIAYMQERFGYESDQITFAAISQILGNIESIVEFMNQSQSSLAEFSTQINGLKTDLDSFETRIIEAQTSFSPVHAELKKIESQIGTGTLTSGSLTQSIKEIEDSLNSSGTEVQALNADIKEQQERLTSVRESLQESQLAVSGLLATPGLPQPVRDTLEQLNLDSAISALDNKLLSDVSTEMADVSSRLDTIEGDISVFTRNLDALEGQIPGESTEFTQMVQQADELAVFMEDAVVLIQSSKSQLQGTTNQLEAMSSSIEDNIASFDKITPEQTRAIVSPITTSQQPLIQKTAKVYLIFPAILPIIIIFISVLFSNIIVLDEIYSSAQMRNFIMPIHDAFILLGFYLTNMLVVFLQVTVLLVFAQLQLDIDIFANVFSVGFTTMLLSSIFIIIGMILAYATNSKENSILISTFTAVGLFLFSDVMYPSELMSPAVAFVVGLNPVVVAEGMIRKILFFNLSLGEMLSSVVYMFGVIVVLAGVLYYTVHKHRHTY
ncbi:MAG: putative nucleic acid-binding Zn-ribbon protein [Candidatus Woesearchaeota archaeon]|jgi:predicted  nucleic acid-binding Zn-ribbon protein/ABC-type multidrug transport system permease subunit